MNQACYQGVHLSRWLPVGVATSCVICLGQPLAMFLTVHNFRERLGSAEVQVRGPLSLMITFCLHGLHIYIYEIQP